MWCRDRIAQSHARPKSIAVRRLVALAPVLLAVGCGGGSHHAPTSRGPGSFPQLRGLPLAGPTGLELLVSADPPYLLDLDNGRVRSVTGLGVHRSGPVLSVLAAGRDAVVWVDRRPLARGAPSEDIYVVRHGRTTATRIAVGSEVVSAAGGRSVWVTSFTSPHRCNLREIDLAGWQLRAPRTVPCSASLLDPGAGTVLAGGQSAIDPASGRVLLRARGLWSIADHFELTVGAPLNPLTLTDLHTGVRRTLRWPSQIVDAQVGADQAAVSPTGAAIALSFSDPAYHLTGTQVTDVWLLYPSSGRWQHVPGTPATVAVKADSMSWTSDGRLVILGRTPTSGPAAHDVVAVWRPGEAHLRVKSVQIPARDSGSDSFVAWTR